MFFGGVYGHGMGGFQGGDRIAPTITSASTANCAENATLSHSLTASETVTWSIVGGADQARFEISGSTLRWASNGTKNYEAPNDANTDNAYVVNVRATDAFGNTSDQTITITVTNVLEVTLAALSLDALAIDDDQPEGTKVGTITGATSGSTVTLQSQSNAGMFAKDGSDIEVGATALDHDTVPLPTITLRETHPDGSNSPRDSVIEIEVRSSGGGGLGPELVVDGDFASAVNWDLIEGDAAMTISGGKLRGPGAGVSDFANAQQNSGATRSATYRTVFTIDSISVGSVQAVIGDGNGTARTSAGTYTQDIVGVGGESFILSLGEGGDAVIDSFSVKEIL